MNHKVTLGMRVWFHVALERRTLGTRVDQVSYPQTMHEVSGEV